MRRLTSLARRACQLAALVLLWASLAAELGLAQDRLNEAGLVIIDGDGAVGYALVTFDEPEISGMELLRRSGAEPVTISFGGLGEGVCGIGQTGCAVDVCRRRMCQTGSPDSPYWQSFSTVDGSTWASLQLGASADRVEDGDVRLWAWTESTPAMGALTLSDISAKVGATRNQITWVGQTSRDGDRGGSPLWLGIALVGVAGAMAATVTIRARARSG